MWWLYSQEKLNSWVRSLKAPFWISQFSVQKGLQQRWSTILLVSAQRRWENTNHQWCDSNSMFDWGCSYYQACILTGLQTVLWIVKDFVRNLEKHYFLQTFPKMNTSFFYFLLSCPFTSQGSYACSYKFSVITRKSLFWTYAYSNLSGNSNSHYFSPYALLSSSALGAERSRKSN